MDASKCVVLVPCGVIEPQCETGLRGLEARGYEVRRIRGYSQIDVARNEIAGEALQDGFEEMFWIDSDTGFDPDDVDRIRAHELPICCGIYAKKGRREFAVKFLPETKEVVFGKNGGLLEIRYAATGFLHIRRQVYDQIHTTLKLPHCDVNGQSFVPFFMPLVRELGGGKWYLGEDYAFCERVRQCGIRIFADTTIRLWHVGSYTYGWEDAGASVSRYGDYRFSVE